MGVHQDREKYLQIKEILDIPADEPIFILRAQDKFSVTILQAYKQLARDGIRNRADNFFEWSQQLSSVISDFINWRRDNKDKIKVPD